MKLRLLLVLCGLVALFAVPAALADTSEAGYTGHFGTFSSYIQAAPGASATVYATFTARTTRTYYLEIAASPFFGDGNYVCATSATIAKGATATLSCAISAAESPDGLFLAWLRIASGPAQYVTISSVGATSTSA